VAAAAAAAVGRGKRRGARGRVMEEEEGEVLSRGWRRCSGEGDRCTVPGHTAMPESAFREHWPPALRLRSLCGTEGGGGREGEGEGEGETVASERWVGVGKREEHRIVSGERSPLARPSIPAAAGCSAAGRSDVPNEYQQAQPPPPPAPLRPRPRPHPHPHPPSPPPLLRLPLFELSRSHRPPFLSLW